MPEINRGVRGNNKVEYAPSDVPSKTIMNISPLEQYVVQYVHGDGTVRTTVVVKLGDAYYEPSNGEDWAKNCKPANEWLATAIKARIDARASMPSTEVDIVG
jgi:hypothetical protein